MRAIGARAQLTPAELDTALQAAAGSTDKQIAELMHLSVRTVENRSTAPTRSSASPTGASWPKRCGTFPNPA